MLQHKKEEIEDRDAVKFYIQETHTSANEAFSSVIGRLISPGPKCLIIQGYLASW
jgi:hypothetical protein